MTTEGTIFYQMSGLERFLFTAIPLLAVLGLLASFGITFYRSAQTSKQWRQDQSVPPSCIVVTVLSKRMESAPMPTPRDRRKQVEPHVRVALCHCASFAPLDGAPPLEFLLPVQAWTALCEGSVGQLCFQGQRFLRFTASENGKSPEEGVAL